MNNVIRILAPSIAAAPALAGEMQVSIEIPRIDVAEYHRPYVAAWIEKPDRSVAANLAVWYDVEMADDEGETWLKDLRQWWRRAGRSLDMPVDGVSGPTRPVGEHALSFDANSAALSQLAAGEYALVVEASREVGGREMLRIPFTWGNGAHTNETARGESELGAVTLNIGNQATKSES